jgi:hypothetical protein
MTPAARTFAVIGALTRARQSRAAWHKDQHSAFQVLLSSWILHLMRLICSEVAHDREHAEARLLLARFQFWSTPEIG